MTNSSKKNLKSIFWFTITIMVILSLICSEGYKIPITGPLMKVEIKNNNTYILDVHCKSADDDIGSRALKNGESYRWQFYVNFFNSTLYFCEFHQGKVTKGVFDIYDALRDFKRCTRCTWMAETDGLYGFSEKKPPPAAVFYKWLN
ncbi:unnamed protein product [Brassica oleracea]|uniref:S-protein homolog n=1 Tax=Brassica oleracea TaxID=3712 RepID=A0A3P6D7Z2_BRAOL|nr:unnamed protein product [Brassica oleracea]